MFFHSVKGCLATFVSVLKLETFILCIVIKFFKKRDFWKISFKKRLTLLSLCCKIDNEKCGKFGVSSLKNTGFSDCGLLGSAVSIYENY